jgi:F420-dependent oxidoreductase-like protein
VTTFDMRFGIQFPRFSRGDEPFEQLSAWVTGAEQGGIDAVFVMDHFWQLPMLGPPDLPMFEGYLTLAALAARTERVQLGTLVTGVTYRNPALLAKEVTTLDVISRGRAILGVGAAWYEQEHDGLGFEFPSTKERFERLEDALHICRLMFTEDRPTYKGAHHSIEGAINVPRPVRPGGPPIMVGGSGERKTLRYVAEHADASNIICGIDEIPHKLEVLQRHLDDAGRDRRDVHVSWLGSLVLGDDRADADAQIDRMLGGRPRDLLAPRLVAGGPDEVQQQIGERLLGAGLDGVIFNLPALGDDDGSAYRRAAEVLMATSTA